MRFFLLFLVVLFPVSAYPYSVATPTTWSSEAAIEVLQKGGNAVDAMVAAAFTMNVSQPMNMGMGGGGFFLATKGDKTWYWDSREAAQASVRETMFLGADGKPIRHYPERVTGPNPVGVPGMVAGLGQAHKTLGKLPWKTLLQPAIKLARSGFPISKQFDEYLGEEWDRIKVFPATAAVFGNGKGDRLIAGQMLRQPVLGATLQTIADKGPREFYEGALARGWVAEAQKSGVKITPEDLNGYQVKTRDALHFKVFGLTAETAPPPSGGSLVVAGTLRFLEDYYRTHDVPDAGSPERMIVTLEALRYFQTLRNQTIADPPHAKLDPQRFPGSADEKAAWKEIIKQITPKLDHVMTKTVSLPASPTIDSSVRPPAPAVAVSGKITLGVSTGPRGHTAHFSVVDDQGMAVSYTTTIEEIFGSGIMVPGYGFLLNNELSDFTPEPGFPNSPAPGKRPRSNMTPTILFDMKSGKRKPVGVVGCAGGGNIPLVITEILENYFIHKMGAREAMAFTRFVPDGSTIMIEKTVAAETVTKLKDAGYAVFVDNVMGTAQVLLRRSPADHWEAATETRGDGLGITIER